MEPRKAKEKIPMGHYGCSGRRGHCRHRRLSNNTESFTSYFSRVLKQVHMGLSLSQEAVNVMSSFMIDIFQCISRGWALGPQKQAPHHHLQRDPDFCELAAAWGDGQTCQVRGHQGSHQRHHQQIGWPITLHNKGSFQSHLAGKDL